MPSLIKAGRRTVQPGTQHGQPQPQAPSSYGQDGTSSGAPYIGTAPMAAPMKKSSKFGKMHAPGKRGR